MRAHRRRGRWWAPPVAAGSALIAVATWGVLAHQPRLPSAGPAPAWAQEAHATHAPQTARPASTATARPSLPPAPALPAVLPVGAESIRVPSLRVSAPAIPESVTDGALPVPDNPAQVGWWMPSTAELVIDGHVDMEGHGPGVLYEVRNLKPGAQVVVQTAGGPEHWKIDGVRTYEKGRVPAGLFHWQGSGARLVIVTCGGPFDEATHHYYDNVIAYGSRS